jgi:hypothetical protein
VQGHKKDVVLFNPIGRITETTNIIGKECSEMIHGARENHIGY